MKFCVLSNSDFEKFGIKVKCEIRFGNRGSEFSCDSGSEVRDSC